MGAVVRDVISLGQVRLGGAPPARRDAAFRQTDRVDDEIVTVPLAGRVAGAVRHEARERRVIAAIHVDVTAAGTLAHEEHFIAGGDDEEGRRVRLDGARPPDAALPLRDDVGLAGFMRLVVGIDVVGIALWLDAGGTFRRQRGPREACGQAAEVARTAGIEAHPSAFELAARRGGGPLRTQPRRQRRRQHRHDAARDDPPDLRHP